MYVCMYVRVANGIAVYIRTIWNLFELNSAKFPLKSINRFICLDPHSGRTSHLCFK